MKYYIHPQLKEQYQKVAAEYIEGYKRYMSKAKTAEKNSGISVYMTIDGEMGYRNKTYFENTGCFDPFFYKSRAIPKGVSIGEFTIYFDKISGLYSSDGHLFYKDFMAQEYLETEKKNYKDAQSKIDDYNAELEILNKDKKELEKQLSKTVFGKQEIKKQQLSIKSKIGTLEINILEEQKKQENAKKIIGLYKNITQEQLIALQTLKREHDLLRKRHAAVKNVIDVIDKNSDLEIATGDCFMSWMEKLLDSSPLSEERAERMGNLIAENIEDHLESGKFYNAQPIDHEERLIVEGIIRYVYEKALKKEENLTSKKPKSNAKK